MRTTMSALLLGSVLATPVAAQAQNLQQLLGGLLTGNQQQDQAVREAWHRGYDRGRADQAREDRDRGDRGYDRDRRPDYPPPPYSPPPYGPPR
jgi:hypothetical protein